MAMRPVWPPLRKQEERMVDDAHRKVKRGGNEPDYVDHGRSLESS